MANKKKLRVFEAFAGIGAQASALERLNVTLVRIHSSKIDRGDTYRRFIDPATSFDYLEYGSNETYPLSFRVVRVKLSGDSYECLVTNLPKDEFPPDRLKKLYYARWNIMPISA